MNEQFCFLIQISLKFVTKGILFWWEVCQNFFFFSEVKHLQGACTGSLGKVREIADQAMVMESQIILIISQGKQIIVQECIVLKFIMIGNVVKF